MSFKRSSKKSSKVSFKPLADRKIHARFGVSLTYAAIGLWLCLTGGFAHAEEFLSVLDDMPLAPGLTELADQAANFDTPAGRIVDATAEGQVDPKTVTAFYDKTLPALGWVQAGAGRFTRDHEQLTISVMPEQAAKGRVTARFSLRPNGAK
jgi:hypothetical protein